jgi:ectoine hydroxylase-related dioxygenase (phytanoyl-CoA dioxygenase family)
LPDLPILAGRYDVQPEHIEAFKRDGHLKLGSVFSREEVDAYRPALKKTVETFNAENHSMEQKVAGAGKNWMFVNNLWTLDPVARRFVLSERLGQIAADLMGVDAVRLFRDQSYFKGPGGANTPWHQDAYFMPLDTDQILTMWIPLTDIDPELAPMSYVTGSHTVGFISPSNGDDESMDAFEGDMSAKGYQIFNYQRLSAGDIAVHSAWTMHSSRSNTARRVREAVVIVFFADGARLVADPPLTRNAPPQEFFARLIRKQNRETSLPGLKSGDLAAGDMTPLVFSR